MRNLISILDVQTRFESSLKLFALSNKEEFSVLRKRKKKRRKETQKKKRRDRVVKERKGYEGHGSIVVRCERVQPRRTVTSET